MCIRDRKKPRNTELESLLVNTKRKRDEEVVPCTAIDDPHVRTLITDDRTTKAPIPLLNVELTCPVCLGIIRNAMTVMECVHRFCEDCITKCLRLGKKECPSCRVKCVSRRSLRRDPNFDEIINAIYPNLEEYEAHLDAEIEAGNTQNAARLHDEGTVAAKAAAKRIQSERRTYPSHHSKISRGPGVNSKQRRELQTVVSHDVEFSFILRRHPLENKLQSLMKEYLKTSRLLTVRHLQKFLSMKLQWDSHVGIRLTTCTCVVNGSNPEPLDKTLTLERVYNEHLDFQRHPIVYYYLESSAKTWAL
eukprot:TRINITY_DN14361_c0_g1_i4.p1 TRINITY_DN14361_c0_g1~~TRINITY_DN14361_c0_g1_i4.p1  ORF type:complete len:305 (+),score=65.36 TRINITY_DN14361_c0_g1_i4:109-1023(+)